MRYSIPVVLLIAIALSFGCNSNSSTGPGPTTPPDTVRGHATANFELTPFDADTTWVEHPNSSQFVIFAVMGRGQSDSLTLILDLTGVADTGTFNLVGDELSNQVGVVRQHSTVYATNTLGGGGLCHITKYDTAKKRVSGTFGFNIVNKSDANDWFVVENGVFTDVKF